ncbi:MAG: HlyD family efflux transporter periplasmic adaptor subunit [Acetatifactor sp.]|nr:HlyD family efflux transporter periplasmic adaptor subunit [Acetatifactor sp.]
MKTKSKKKRKVRKIIKWVIILLIIVGIIVVVTKVKSSKNKVTIPTVVTTKAYRGDLQEQISATGFVRGEENVVIYAPASGNVLNVMPKVGDEVQEGDLLLSYDLEALDESLYQAKLQNERTQISYEVTLNGNAEGKGKVSEADTNLPVLKQQIADHEKYLENLQTELANYQTKQSDDAILLNHQLTKQRAELMEALTTLDPGTEEYEKTQKQLNSVNAQLEQLALNQSLSQKPAEYAKELQEKIKQEQETLADLRTYQAEMERQKTTGEATVMDSYQKRQLEIDMELTKLNYDKLLKGREEAEKGITAPYHGVITSVSAAPGNGIAEGTPVFTLERLDKLKVDSTATKYMLDRLNVGQRAEIEIMGDVHEGRVSHISRFAQTTNLSVVVVGFEVEILGSLEDIYLETDVKMTIDTNHAENALLLPAEAVNANMDGDFVYVLQGDVISVRPVTCGITSEGLVEILSGITEEDEIVSDYDGEIEEGVVVERR